MTQPEVEKRLQYALQLNTELSDLEFKSARTDVPNDIWRSISAFANRRGGGVVVFGVREEPNKFIAIGVQGIERMQKKLADYFSDKMSYVIRDKYYIIQYAADIVLLAVYIPECPKDYMPCYFKAVGLPNGAYIREGNTSRKITDNEFRTYVASSKEFQFDSSEALGTNVQELSNAKIKILLQKREDAVKRGATQKVTPKLLKNLGIIAKFDDAEQPTVAGFLLFSQRDPQAKQSYERYSVRCVRYSGTATADSIIDQVDIKGTLDEQIDEAYKFVLKNIKKTAHIQGTKRVEKYEYPEAAIRELIANSVIHRDYKIIETYTQIRIFDDRIEITNPGSLPPGVTIDNIQEAQFSRNPIIAARLKDLNYLEEYGRGIDIVINKMREWGLQVPLFRNIVNSFQVILLGQKYESINDRQLKIIHGLLLKGKLTIKDCSKILKQTSRPTLNKDINELKKLRVIKSNGASVSTYYTLSF